MRAIQVLGGFVCMLITANTAVFGAGDHRVVCYYPDWSADSYKPEDIDTSLCTHVNIAFGSLDVGGSHLVAGATGLYSRIAALKQRRADLKVLLSVGGWSMGSNQFSALVSAQSKMDTFASGVIDFLHKSKLDGLDLDWEYPGARGSPARDKHAFTVLLQTLHAAFQKDHQTTNRNQLLLTMALAPSPSQVRTSYEVPAIANYLDFINVMTYDMHGEWDHVVGHHATLYSPTADKSDSIDSVIKNLLSLNTPSHKIVLGVPFYGNAEVLANPSNYKIGAPITGAGREMEYKEICKVLQGNVVHGRLSGTKAPYLVHGNTYVGYDDPTSLREKVDYVLSNNLGGIMIWSIDQDDHTGACGQGKNPLLHAINSQFANSPVGRR